MFKMKIGEMEGNPIYVSRNYGIIKTWVVINHTLPSEIIELDARRLKEFADIKKMQEYIGLPINKINDRLGHRKAEHAFYWNSSQWMLPTKKTYNQLIKVFEIDKRDHFKEYDGSPLKSTYKKEHECLIKKRDFLRYTYNVLHNNGKFNDFNSCVWNYNPAPKIGHSTPKPIDLLMNIILHSSNENDLVFDPTAGSMSTAIACNNTNRNWICIEKDKEYCNMGIERIRKEKQKQKTERQTKNLYSFGKNIQ